MVAEGNGSASSDVAVDFRNARSRFCVPLLFRTSHCCALTARSVHRVGDLRSFVDTLAAGSSLAAYRFSCLGNPYRSTFLALSADPGGELARRPGWHSALPGRLSAPLPGQACLSRRLRNCSDGCRRPRLRSQSCALRAADVDRSQSLIPDASLLSCPAKRNQLPLSVRCRCLLSKDVEIPVIRLNFVEDALGVVPLIEHGLDLVLPFSKPEANGSLIGLSARITFHGQFHRFHCG